MALHAQLELAAWLRPRTAATIYLRPAGGLHRRQRGRAAGRGPRRVTCSCPARSRRSHWPAPPTPATPSGPSSNTARTPSSSSSPKPAVCVATRDDPEPRSVPTDVVDAVDSTGAGDAFCGAFAAEHLRSGDPYAAARAGGAAARIAVSGPVSTALLDRRHRRGGAMTRITVINPNTSAELTATITAAAQAVAGPASTVTGVNPTVGVPSVESHAEEADRRRRCARTGAPAPGATPTPSSSPASVTPVWPPPARSPPARSSE